MVIEGSREYKAAQELERALNDYSWNPKKFAESTRYYHRTLQQELMKTIVEIIRMVGNKNYGTDLRNQASHELCKRIVDRDRKSTRLNSSHTDSSRMPSSA